MEEILLHLKESVAGVEHIKPKIIKGAVKFLSEPLANVINLSFQQDISPQALKKMGVSPTVELRSNSNGTIYQ